MEYILLTLLIVLTGFIVFREIVFRRLVKTVFEMATKLDEHEENFVAIKKYIKQKG